MKALIQRVTKASVDVEGQRIGEISGGLLVLLGIEAADSEASIPKMADRLLAYRVFADADGRMNRSVADVDGGILLVSQFTLAADTRKGLRPGFSTAAAPDVARNLYELLLAELRNRHSVVECGEFGANMQVALVNDGPVTFLLEV